MEPPTFGAKRAAGKTRALVLHYAKMGLGVSEIARVVNVSRQSVSHHLKKLREDGLLEEKAS